MGTITQERSIMPASVSGNPNAIFFAISDNYSFAVANLIMSLNRHSEELMQKTDILIYHNGISEKNEALLRSLHSNTYCIPMQFPDEWTALLEHPKTAPWGAFVICKLFGFELIERYEKALHLDADMHIMGDISPLLELEEEFAWRSIIGWNISAIFADLIPPDTQMRSGNGGMLLFTDKLKKYGIDHAAVRAAFEETKDLKDGGTDELAIAWLVYKKGVLLKEMDMAVFNTPPSHIGPDTKLVHFVSNKAVPTKPWENPASYLYFDEWAQNYNAWLDMGGEGPVSFSKEDYYRLFAYDKVAKIRKLNASVKKLRKANETYAEDAAKRGRQIAALTADNEKQAEEVAKCKKKIAELRAKNEQQAKLLAAAEHTVADLKNKAKSSKQRISELEKSLKTIRNSKSWKLTKPLRMLLAFCKKLLPGRKRL